MSELLTIAEASARCRLCEKTLRRAIKSKKLRASQPGGRGGKIIVSVDDLNAWLFSSASQPEAPPSVPLGPRVRPYVSTRYDF